MGLRGCFGCLKFFVFVVNFLFWLFGLGVMSVSLWLLFDQQLYLQSVGAQQTDYYVGTYIILAVGGIMTLVGFLGCCGAWKESTWMLGTFFMFLIIIFLGEIAVGVLVYFNEAPYQDMIRRSVEATVAKKYNNSSMSATAHTFDLIQEGLQCCGADGPSDWARSLYNRQQRMQAQDAPEIGISNNRYSGSSFAPPSSSSTFRIPASCCIGARTSRACVEATQSVDPKRIPTTDIWDQGCSLALVRFVESHMIYLVAMAGGVALIQLTGMLFSLCLCCALRRIDDFKA